MAVSPAYSIHRYRDDIYKVVAFKGNRDPDSMYVRDREDQQHNGNHRIDCCHEDMEHPGPPKIYL